MSTFSVQVVLGPLLGTNELVTNDRINQLVQDLIINVTGSIGTALIPDGSITNTKFAAGALSADAIGRAAMADGFLTLAKIASGIYTADAAGRAPFANGWLTLALIASGIFTANTAGRAPFAAGALGAGQLMPDKYGYPASNGGTASAYTATFSPTLASYASPSFAYSDGLLMSFKATATCAANVTFDPSGGAGGLGPKGMYRMDGTALQAGDIASGQLIQVAYNSSLASGAGGWQLITPLATLSPAYYRAGQFTTVAAASTTVNFTSATPGNVTTYAVSCMNRQNIANTALFVSAKNAGSFVCQNVGASATVAWDYMILPNN